MASPSTLAAALARCAAFRPIITEVLRHEGKGSKTKKVNTGMFDVMVPPMGALSYVDEADRPVMMQAAEMLTALAARVHKTQNDLLIVGIKDQFSTASKPSDYQAIVEAVSGVIIGSILAVTPRMSDHGLQTLECYLSVRLVGTQAKSDAAATVIEWERELHPHRYKCEQLLRAHFLKALG